VVDAYFVDVPAGPMTKPGARGRAMVDARNALGYEK
jgi:hypothetical protein